MKKKTKNNIKCKVLIYFLNISCKIVQCSYLEKNPLINFPLITIIKKYIYVVIAICYKGSSKNRTHMDA